MPVYNSDHLALLYVIRGGTRGLCAKGLLQAAFTALEMCDIPGTTGARGGAGGGAGT